MRELHKQRKHGGGALSCDSSLTKGGHFSEAFRAFHSTTTWWPTSSSNYNVLKKCLFLKKSILPTGKGFLGQGLEGTGEAIKDTTLGNIDTYSLVEP